MKEELSSWQISLCSLRITHTVRACLAGLSSINTQADQCVLDRVSFINPRAAQMLTHVVGSKVSSGQCGYLQLLYTGVCVAPMWFKAVFNLCFHPQGWQGQKWSDIRLGAPAGSIKWYSSFCHKYYSHVLVSYFCVSLQSIFLIFHLLTFLFFTFMPLLNPISFPSPRSRPLISLI